MVPDQSSEYIFAPRAVEGIKLYNRKLFFEAHEALEDAWRADPGKIRSLYQGILQVGVGFYHLEKGNAAGARKMFIRAWKLLSNWENENLPFDLSEFIIKVKELDGLARDEQVFLSRTGVNDWFFPINLPN